MSLLKTCFLLQIDNLRLCVDHNAGLTILREAFRLIRLIDQVASGIGSDKGVNEGLIGMIVEARVAHPAKTFVIGLTLDRIFCQGVFSTISRREMLGLFDAYVALVRAASEVQAHEAWKQQVRDHGGLLLSIDGIQPDKSNETVYLVRDIFLQKAGFESPRHSCGE